MSKTNIRKLALADLDQIETLLIGSIKRKEFDDTISNAKKIIASQKKNFDKLDDIYYVYVDRDNIAGYCICEKNIPDKISKLDGVTTHNHGYLVAFAVHPEHRGKKIADKLIKTVLDKAKKRFTGVYSMTSTANIASQKLHERNGFVKIKKIEDKSRKKDVRSIIYLRKFKRVLFWKV